MQFNELVKTLTDTPCQTSQGLNPEISAVAAIDAARQGDLSFIEGSKFANRIQETQASALILPESQTLQALATDRQIAWIAVQNPRLMFAQAIALFYKPFALAPDVHPTAVIHPTAILGEAVAIGAHVTIQAGAKIGDQVCIHPNVVIYPQVEIGDRSVLHANCVIHERSQIGPDCLIHSGAVIGAEGFGFVPTATGWHKMPQSGFVVLEAEVEVGCQTAIDRPSVGETRIGRGTKIDNLVQIGHGCQIGDHCLLVAQTGLAGRVELGAGVVLAAQVGIADQVKVGAKAIATARSGIMDDIPAGTVVGGAPAIAHKTFLKTIALFHRLPELFQSVKKLQQQASDAARKSD
jgi:UDP-3-O-[3-hydroxymyristoyl] glucosamine N-acyltransferase